MAFPPESSHSEDVLAIARRLRTTPDKFLDFSGSANIFAAPLTEGLMRATPYPFLHYPDDAAEDLIEAIAAHEDLPTDRILPGSGATEILWLFLRGLAPRKTLLIGPVYSEYVRACQTLGIPFDILVPSAENDFRCSPDDVNALWESDADMVILCTPNNPTGVVHNWKGLLPMLRAPRLLIDCTSHEFLYGTDEYEENSPRAWRASVRPGVSVFTLHSFSAFFCCPGLRLGYLTGERSQLVRLAALRPAWNISPFAQLMGGRFLANLAAYRETLPALRQSIAHMGRELRRLPCIDPDRTFEGPGFLCCGLTSRFHTAAVRKTLLNQRILTRDCGDFPGMPEGFLRLRARPESDAARLLAVLETV